MLIYNLPSVQEEQNMKQDTIKEYEYYLLQMLRIRLFEERVMDLLARNIVEGASHLYTGEEAVAVGSCAAIKRSDYITSSHRGHGHCIAKGADLKKMMAEVCGKSTGYCKGRGGSMHICDIESGNLGATGIVGGNIPIATGAGLSIKLKKTEQVCLCFFGDGASNTGAFHESLNMASTWKLPVVYICENNLYGMSVSVQRACPHPDIAMKAEAYCMPSYIVDGMDVLAVKGAVGRFVEKARKGDGPALIECKTYRYFGHSRSDPRAYRTKEEEAEWKERCPILNLKEKMIKARMIDEKKYLELENQVKKEIDEAEKYAMESPYPKPEELYDNVYV
jgi:pyruvate dehydrogenase E1 component alpha subunit